MWPAYSRWLPGGVAAYVRLETSPSKGYSALPEVAQTLSLLHGLNHDIGRMPLYCQRASCPDFGGGIGIPDKPVLGAMAAGIERGFAQLTEHDQALAQELNAHSGAIDLCTDICSTRLGAGHRTP